MHSANIVVMQLHTTKDKIRNVLVESVNTLHMLPTQTIRHLKKVWL